MINVFYGWWKGSGVVFDDCMIVTGIEEPVFMYAFYVCVRVRRVGGASVGYGVAGNLLSPVVC